VNLILTKLATTRLLPASLNWITKVDSVSTVAVPLILPSVFTGNTGEPPETLQLYGGRPPLATNVCENGTPTSPLRAKAPGPSMVNWGVIVRGRGWSLVAPRLSVTLTENEVEPLVVGLPEISPTEDRFRPFGSDPDARLQA
jgi:hypothetical protein